MQLFHVEFAHKLTSGEISHIISIWCNILNLNIGWLNIEDINEPKR